MAALPAVVADPNEGRRLALSLLADRTDGAPASVGGGTSLASLGSVTELISNEVQLGINAVPSVLQYVKTGKLTAIGMASATRATALPDVPTVAESGVPGFDYTIWYGLFAPVKTPADVVNRINADLQRALKDGAVARQLIAQGSEPAGNTPQEFARYISEDTAKWARIVKERKLKVEE